MRPRGSESGWRLDVTQRGDTISASWTISSNADHSWSTYSVRASPTKLHTFSGPLYLERERTGEPSSARTPNAPLYPVLRLERERLGTATFVFADEDHGNLTYQETNYEISRSPKRSTTP